MDAISRNGYPVARYQLGRSLGSRYGLNSSLGVIPKKQYLSTNVDYIRCRGTSRKGALKCLTSSTNHHPPSPAKSRNQAESSNLEIKRYGRSSPTGAPAKLADTLHHQRRREVQDSGTSAWCRRDDGERLDLLPFWAIYRIVFLYLSTVVLFFSSSTFVH